ncbi:MAG: MarR family transcriptional regulator [Deltaproteobacteria bacterium]|nr:MarR family transcriptional regulator [Deltaproteobacteria bacterium]
MPKLACILWDQVENEADERSLTTAYRSLISSETPDFEAHWSGLTLVQRNLLKAIALSPDSVPYSKEFLKRSGLSLGGTQKALTLLIERDLVEKTETGLCLTDPIMAVWLGGHI